MILYTSMPEELIFPVQNADFESVSTIEMNGLQMVVRQTEQNQYEIVRLLSTDPQDFLNEQYSPGQKISMTFSFSS
jgi:YlzJ-like protein